MNNSIRFSIRTRLIIWFLLVCFIAISVITTLTYKVTFGRIVEQQVSVSNAYNQSIAAGLNQWFAKRLSELEIAALSEDMTSDNPTKQSIFVKEIKSRIPEYETTFFLDTHGTIKAHTRPGALGLNYGDREYFQKAMEGQANISDVLISRVTGDQVMVVATPVYKSHKIIGVLAASITFSELTNEFFSKLTSANASGNVLLAARNGEIVYDDNYKFLPSTALNRAIMNSKKGENTLQLAKQEYVVTKAPLSTVGYTVYFITQIQALLQSEKQLTYIIVGIALGVFTCIAVLVWFIARSFSKPIGEIARNVKVVADGDLNVKPVTIAKADEIGVLATNFNIMVAKLKTSVEKLDTLNQVIIQNSATGIIITDKSGVVTQYNNLASVIFGINAENMEHYDIKHHKDLGEYIRNVLVYRNVYYNVQLETYSREGERIVYLLDVFGIYEGDNQIAGAFVQLKDITQMKVLEEQVRRLDKLALVGQMAAGFAHEIRNPLTSVKGFVQLLFEGSEHLSAYRNLVLSEIDRISKLVTDFVLVTKPSHPQMKRVNIRDIVSEASNFVATEALMHNISLTCHMGREDIYTIVDPEQITQVLLNVVKNAIEAIGDNGLVDISLEVQTEKVLIRVTDNGPGITPSDLNHITNPFFTTKDTGTGLGLSVSARIVEAHKGSLDFKSSSHGTTVIITLPVEVTADSLAQ